MQIKLLDLIRTQIPMLRKKNFSSIIYDHCLLRMFMTFLKIVTGIHYLAHCLYLKLLQLFKPTQV